MSRWEDCRLSAGKEELLECKEKEGYLIGEVKITPSEGGRPKSKRRARLYFMLGSASWERDSFAKEKKKRKGKLYPLFEGKKRLFHIDLKKKIPRESLQASGTSRG